MKLGHAVKLMAAQYVKAHLKGNKNDGNGAEAICEAVGRPGMRFVAINTEGQQDIQMLHRIRGRLLCERTALINQVRGLSWENMGSSWPGGQASPRSPRRAEAPQGCSAE